MRIRFNIFTVSQQPLKIPSLSHAVRYLRPVKYFRALPNLPHFPQAVCFTITMQNRQFYGSSNKLQAPPPPSVSTNAPQCKVTIDFLARLLAKSNNLIKHIFAVPEFYENCQLLQPVNEFVQPVPAIQPSDADRQLFAIRLTPYSSSPIRSHSVYHIQMLPFALQLYALSPNTNPFLKCIVWTACNVLRV